MLKLRRKEGEEIMEYAAVEIERKYVILKPDFDALGREYPILSSEIWQTYLRSEEGVTRRVRKRVFSDRTIYTLTEKRRIDKLSSYEDEREVGKEEYEELLSEKRSGTRTLKKTRRVVRIGEVDFEIDEYPEWERTCIMETELKSREERVQMPDFIRILAEVTGNRAYTNAAMLLRFPDELI